MMRIRLSSLLAIACLFSAPALADQSAPKPPANDDCLACHGDADARRADGRAIAVDATRFQGSTHGPMACVDCHADLAKITEFPYAEKLGRVNCGSCHDDIAGKYHDSIHSWAKDKAGLVGAPACADCHGKHDIKPHTDKSSRVYRESIPATCGTCHAGVLERYAAGVHSAALKRNDSRAPVCIDCHTTHAIQRTDSDGWRLGVTAECGTCHANVVDSFRRTFHGKVTELGFTRVAACADCHGAHDILPAANPASTVSKAHLVETCGKCHPGANERFIKYDPHPNPGDYKRSAVLWWANRFYWVLIPGCFGFFALHSALWYRRSTRDRQRRREDHQ
jgi:Cytochrome c7 and related cytochrome c